MNIILIGIQGSGKSTQGNLLGEKLKLPYLSSGQVFRGIAKEDTEWGKYVRETLNAGHLISDDKTIKIIEEYLQKPEFAQGYILDGFPRTVAQAMQFSKPVDKVIYLKVSDEEALNRLRKRTEGGVVREDDTDAAIKRRIGLFHEHTEPVLDFYRKKGVLEEIDGEQSIEDIHKEVMSRFGESN